MRKTKLFCWVVMLTFISLGFPLDEFYGKHIAVAQAESSQQPDDIAKEIDKELRSAERSMFSGKNEEADKQLEEIFAKIGVLKKLDSEHKKIKALESNYERTRKAIDKKLGRTAKVASGEIRGLAKKSEVKESSGDIRGLAEKSETKESSGDIRGLAEKSEGTEMPAPEPKKMSAIERKRAMITEREKKAAGDPTVQVDIDKIIEIYDANASKFKQIHGGNIANWTVGSGIEESKQALAKIEQAERDFDPISTDVGRLAEKYALSGYITNNIKAKLGANPQGDPGNKLEALMLAGAAIGSTRTATSEQIVSSATQLVNVWADQVTDARLERLENAKKLLVLAVQIDPKNENAKNLLGETDGKIAQFSDKMKDTIDKNVWKENVSSVGGPGNVATLAAAAKKYFEDEPNWGGRKNNKLTIVAVAVTGPWKVAERDVFGRVIRWRLPVNLAVTDENFQSRNIAQVFGLSVLAREGGPGNAPQEPPWNDFWVGDSYMMRLDKF